MTLTQDEQRAFGEAAQALRFGNAEGRTETPIEAIARTTACKGCRQRSLAHLQPGAENAIRGGLTAWGRDAQNRPRRVTSREVTGIDGDMRLYRALWALTERMAELKGAA
ncbi:hypothetical protein [Falsiroseomonas sp.]|uniref:hypothetical protein n=1 Tax=Falsiroseomonas sp. TaxID=2870721 RepID=UPI00356409BD